MKKLLRNRGNSLKGRSSVFITTGIFPFVTLVIISRSILSCGLLSTKK